MTFPDKHAEERLSIWRACLRPDDQMQDLAEKIVGYERELDALRHEVQVKRFAEGEIEELGVKASTADESPIHALIDAYKAQRTALENALSSIVELQAAMVGKTDV